MRHIIPISGKDSCATAIVQKAIDETLPYTYLFNDVAAEFPETYVWLDKVEKALGVEIVRKGVDLERLIIKQGFIPSFNARYCTRLAKIEPMESYIGKEEAYVYYGLRHDEPEREGYRANNKYNITPKYPLRDMKMGINEVWFLLEQRDLLPPQFFWEDVYNKVMYILSVNNHIPVSEVEGRIDAVLKKYQKYPLFAWRSRTNCYFCFYQRLYEWVGLLEHHPDLFDKSEWYEKNVGNENYTWNSNYPLERVRKESTRLKGKRIRHLVQKLQPIVDGQVNLENIDEYDLLTFTSCGLTCGK